MLSHAIQKNLADCEMQRRSRVSWRASFNLNLTCRQFSCNLNRSPQSQVSVNRCKVVYPFLSLVEALGNTSARSGSSRHNPSNEKSGSPRRDSRGMASRMIRSNSRRHAQDTNPELPTSESSSKLKTRRRSSATLCSHKAPLSLALLVCLLLLYVINFRTTAVLESARVPLPIQPANDSETTPHDAVYLHAGKPPLVDRKILEKLADLESADADENTHLSGASNTFGWPPAVTRIPEPTLPRLNAFQSQEYKMSTEDMDYETCGTSPCRYLLPLRVGEQESKARLHLAELAQLAQALGRTLVLPNVGKSRIGACYRWDFGAYYDVDTLAQDVQQLSENQNIMRLDEFKSWTATRLDKATAQVVVIDTKGPASDTLSRNATSVSSGVVNMVVDHEQDAVESKLARCAPGKFPRLDFSAYAPVFVYPPGGDSRVENFGMSLVDSMTTLDNEDTALRGRSDPLSSLDASPLSNTVADVLLVDWDLRHPVFVQPTPPQTPLALAYSPKLLRLAENLAAPLGPYLVVHWRMETIPPDALPHCAAALIDTLVSLLSTGTEVRTVWFASDYPQPITRPRFEADTTQFPVGSGTFKDFTPEHEEAIDALRAAFASGGPLEGARLTGLAEEMARLKRAASSEWFRVDEELLQDPGVLGILDKVVATRAALFVSGAKGCGRASSFTRQIVYTRDDMIGKGVGEPEQGPRNLVELFG
ncbi:hypothetical protein PLICRDRAFT_336854 [Plicaturopsis crispa FD-325 SS-3]|uniref:Proteophosphoglycan 5 n=1 Tax=Plicaturopsis crispa FD-325 SS-3 TaxID=944288 RepID=A0A0C9SYT8_PLICR|nr:hypothetical protein PLICRDRAFT_336854 [Plicaturopsis crispa FD-325 SS-3]